MVIVSKIAVIDGTATVMLTDHKQCPLSMQVTVAELRDPGRFAAAVQRETGQPLAEVWPDPATWRGWLWFVHGVPLDASARRSY